MTKTTTKAKAETETPVYAVVDVRCLEALASAGETLIKLLEWLPGHGIHITYRSLDTDMLATGTDLLATLRTTIHEARAAAAQTKRPPA